MEKLDTAGSVNWLFEYNSNVIFVNGTRVPQRSVGDFCISYNLGGSTAGKWKTQLSNVVPLFLYAVTSHAIPIFPFSFLFCHRFLRPFVQFFCSHRLVHCGLVPNCEGRYLPRETFLHLFWSKHCKGMHTKNTLSSLPSIVNYYCAFFCLFFSGFMTQMECSKQHPVLLLTVSPHYTGPQRTSVRVHEPSTYPSRAVADIEGRRYHNKHTVGSFYFCRSSDWHEYFGWRVR